MTKHVLPRAVAEKQVWEIVLIVMNWPAWIISRVQDSEKTAV